MTANPDDASGLVEKALSQCEAAFIHGVHSFHGGHQSDLLIRPDALRGLKEAMRRSFHDRLGGDDGPGHWDRDGQRVKRVGFYAGALAAFQAYADLSEWVEERHLKIAMEHVAQHCNNREDIRIRWVYCP